MRSFDASRRQCARFGCTAVASATFTFDSTTGTVWLDTPLEGGPRAGELCTRHARLLTPPRGWRLEDRRAAVAPVPAREETVPAREETAPAREEMAPAPESPAPAPESPAPARAEAGPARQLAAGPADGELEDELRGLLDANSPLLARAFRSSGTV